MNSFSAGSQEPACKSVSSAGGFLTTVAFSKAKVSNPDYPCGKCMHNGNTCKSLEHPHRPFLLQFPLRSFFPLFNGVSFSPFSLEVENKFTQILALRCFYILILVSPRITRSSVYHFIRRIELLSCNPAFNR